MQRPDSAHTKKQAKYIEIARLIKQKIEDGTFDIGDKIYSEHHLAQKFSVSRQTARHAISVLEQEDFLIRRQGSGTFVAKTVPSKTIHTKRIGVILTYLESYIFPTIIDGIDQVLSQNGYTLLFATTRNQLELEQRCLLQMLDSDVDGVIIEPTKSALPNPNAALLHQLEQAGTSLIFLNASYPDMPFPCVRMDDQAAGALATQCLLDASHTAIAGIFQSDNRQGHLRYAGYLEALSKAGVLLKSNRVLWYTTEDIPYLMQDFERIQRVLCDCSGVVCYNDQIALSLIDALHQQGRFVPQDCSVVGIDGVDLSDQVAVSLTSVKNPIHLLGKTIANHLLMLISSPSLVMQAEAGTLFPPTLIQKSSVRCLINGSPPQSQLRKENF